VSSVTVRGLGKDFSNGVKAVEALDLDIADGEFVVFLGPSGCGKTTTLNMIAGLEKASRGSIKFDGQRVDHLPANHRDVAMVFQSYALYPNMTVRDNLSFGLKIRKTPKAERETRIREAADILGIAELLDRKPGQLSGGQRQRVALGRAIVRHPRVFLLDEPLSNVDAKLRAQMRLELKGIHRRIETTFIYVTHDQVEAMSMGDRIAVMNGGQLLQFDSPTAIYNKPTNVFVASFVGSPAMNFFEGRLAGGRFVSKDVSYMVGRPPGGGESVGRDRAVILGVRPGDVRLNVGRSELNGHIAGIVEFNEPLGSDNFVSLRVGTTIIVARTEPDVTLPRGEDVSVEFVENKVHLFDAESGDRLGVS